MRGEILAPQQDFRDEIILGLGGREIQHPEIGKIAVFPDIPATARASAAYIAHLAIHQPTGTYIFPTGNTWEPVYDAMQEEMGRRGADYIARLRTGHLDEYWPYPSYGEYSFQRYIRERVIQPFQIREYQVIDGMASDPVAEAERYNGWLKEQPITFVGLGIGPWPGGHIGFNEAGARFDEETHYVPRLSDETRYRDQVERGQDTPDGALTVGIKNILESGHILLVAYGDKGAVLRPVLNKPIDRARPASALRIVGSKVTIFIDEEAASYVFAGESPLAD